MRPTRPTPGAHLPAMPAGTAPPCADGCLMTTSAANGAVRDVSQVARK